MMAAARGSGGTIGAGRSVFFDQNLAGTMSLDQNESRVQLIETRSLVPGPYCPCLGTKQIGSKTERPSSARPKSETTNLKLETYF
jgi:hypothetical protein